MTTVELHAAFKFICDHCGTEGCADVPRRDLDPTNPDDRMQITWRVEDDLGRLMDRVGFGPNRLFLKDDVNVLRAILNVAEGRPDSRYADLSFPQTVFCGRCEMVFGTTRGSDAVDDLNADDGSSGGAFDDDEDDDDSELEFA